MQIQVGIMKSKIIAHFALHRNVFTYAGATVYSFCKTSLKINWNLKRSDQAALFQAILYAVTSECHGKEKHEPGLLTFSETIAGQGSMYKS